ELMWKQPHASAKKRPDHIVLTNAAEATNVSQRLGIERAAALRTFGSRIPDPRSRPGHAHQRIAVGSNTQRGTGAREMHDQRTPLDGRDAAVAELGIEAVCELIARFPGLRGTGHLPMIAS